MFNRMAMAAMMITAVVAALTWSGPATAADAKAPNLAQNGGFENGEAGWMWQQWKGKPLPGYIDKDDMAEGLASFQFHQDDVSSELYMAKEIHFEAGKDYVLSFALKTQDVPQGAARVRVGIDGRGWLGAATGHVDVVKTGGTQAWKQHRIELPADVLGNSTKLTVFFYHERPDTGTIGIDAVSLTPGETGAGDGAPGEKAPADPQATPKQASPGGDPGDNVMVNGGFENGAAGWMWQQWKGKPLPGYVDKDDMAEGLASFAFTQEGVNSELYMARQAPVEAGKDYRVTLMLKPQGMAEKTARVRVMIVGSRWLMRSGGRPDLVTTGGTHDWKQYTIDVPAAAIGEAEKITVFIYHDKPSEGSLGVDAVTVTPTEAPAAEAEVPPAAEVSAPAPPPTAAPRGFASVTYTATDPVRLIQRNAAPLAIELTPDRSLYRTGQLPAVTVRSIAPAGTSVRYRILDGFGNELVNETTQAASATVAVPAGHGYYEIIATLTRGGETLAEARRSLGVLDAPAEAVGDEPFGLWIQGRELYPELGVRWVREGVYWKMYESQGDSYLADRADLFDWYRQHGMRVVVWPKNPNPHTISREVIEDTPEAWRDLEAWWTKMVQELSGHVDAWGVVNEPINGHWKGDNELIMRYWALMRRIVDRHDPGTPLTGPSLGVSPANVTQYRELLALGFGDHIDAVDLHTYITSPEDNGLDAITERVRAATREAVGEDLPIWSTEMGTTASYETELLQAQHLMRSWLEAKRIGYPVMIWHMFSHPQGGDEREVGFGIFRNGKYRNAVPQPRPAGLAYGVMTRQLAGAAYKSRLDYLGPSVNAYVFERDGKAVLALWTTSRKTYDVTLSVGDERNVAVTGLFGREESLAIRDGLIHLTVDRNPKFIAPMPAFYLDSAPIAELQAPIQVLPGQTGSASLALNNPTQSPAEVRVEWLPHDGWTLSLPQESWSLEPGQSATARLTAQAGPDLAIGQYQLYAKVLLNGKYVTALAAPTTVLPQVELVDLRPSFDDAGRAMLSGTLRRIDPSLDEAVLQLAEGRSAPVTVGFGEADRAAFAVPVNDPAADHLEAVTLVVTGSHDKVQLREQRQVSFVPVVAMSTGPAIDGDLSDWKAPAGRGDDAGALRVSWGWDARNLYLALRVSDPTHIQDQAPTQMWKDDSVQIGLAPNDVEQLVRPYLPGLQEADMVGLDLALREDGPAMYRHRTVNKHLAPVGEVSRGQIEYAAAHEAGVTTYELRIPVEQVGLKPLHAEQVLRGSILINANEGRGRQTTEWFGGIVSGKDPNLFGHLTLCE